MDVLTPLARDNPQLPKYRDYLATCLINLAVLHTKAGRPLQALSAYQDAKSVREKLVADLPKHAKCQADLAGTHHSIGILHLALRKPEKALTAYRKALNLSQSIVRANPAAISYQITLAKTRYNIGLTLRERGQFEEALSEFNEAIQFFKQAASAKPESSAARLNLKNAIWQRAFVFNQLWRFCEAASDWRTLIRMETGPRRTAFAVGLSLSLSRCGATDEATKFAAAITRTARDPATIYDLSCVYAISSHRVLHNLSMRRSERIRNASRYCAESMERLRRCATRGFFRTFHGRRLLATDPDLDPLRNRNDFQCFCREQGVYSYVVARKPLRESAVAPKPPTKSNR